MEYTRHYTPTDSGGRRYGYYINYISTRRIPFFSSDAYPVPNVGDNHSNRNFVNRDVK